MAADDTNTPPASFGRPSPSEVGTSATDTPLPSPDVQKRYIHSDIYSRLVEGDDDLLGLVAYGLYQAAKRRWINAFEAKHGRTPSEPEVQNYCFTYDETALEKLRNESYELIFQVTEERLEERVREVTEHAFNARAIQELGDLRDTLRERTGLGHHIIGHFAGFFSLVGLFALVLLAVHIGEPQDWILARLGLTK